MAPTYFLLFTLAANNSSITGANFGNLFSINRYNFPFSLSDLAIKMMPAKINTTSIKPIHALAKCLLADNAKRITTGKPTRKTVNNPAKAYNPLAW